MKLEERENYMSEFIKDIDKDFRYYNQQKNAYAARYWLKSGAGKF